MRKFCSYVLCVLLFSLTFTTTSSAMQSNRFDNFSEENLSISAEVGIYWKAADRDDDAWSTDDLSLTVGDTIDVGILYYNADDVAHEVLVMSIGIPKGFERNYDVKPILVGVAADRPEGFDYEWGSIDVPEPFAQCMALYCKGLIVEPGDGVGMILRYDIVEPEPGLRHLMRSIQVGMITTDFCIDEAKEENLRSNVVAVDIYPSSAMVEDFKRSTIIALISIVLIVVGVVLALVFIPRHLKSRRRK